MGFVLFLDKCDAVLSDKQYYHFCVRAMRASRIIFHKREGVKKKEYILNVEIRIWAACSVVVQIYLNKYICVV